MKNENTEKRRDFLKKMFLIGGATATYAVTANAKESYESSPIANADSESQGYAKTEHNRTYYTTARF